MASHRIQKAAEAVREVVSMAILTDLKDPRIQDVTVTFVEMSPDMRHAKVHVSVMGNETKQRLSLAGLKNAAGFLQSKVAKRIDTRYTPRLVFVLDMGVKKSIQIAEILHRVLPPAAPGEAPPEPAQSGPAQPGQAHPDQAAGATIDTDVTDEDPFGEEE
jgi:ribosome-binding factor A